jgi:hypothetical protein
MNLVHIIENGQIEYPYNLWQLRKDYPNISFPFEPTPEDLLPFNVFPVTSTTRPDDTRDERAIEGEPILTETGWIQVWDIRPATEAEIEEWDAIRAPEPDWMGFGIEMASTPNIIAMYAAIPGTISNALSIGLSEASKGDTRLFIGIWHLMMAAGYISSDLLEEINTLAYQFNIPDDFIAQIMLPSAE